ncbi:MAG TPA: VOC family protein, partial [Candidatus Sulfopaludibacter sp.]|nr:VOC family protein [Candidatus Sulfopaludibacter sp.]
PFWVDRMGFQNVASVPEGDRLGFVMLVQGGAELMLQTVASVLKDEPKFAPQSLAPNVGLFLEVDDFAATVKRLEGYPVAMDERTTFYGMREIGVRAPSGHTVVFAVKV